jgi:hypothetical protein
LPHIDKLRAFDVANATVSLWVFRKSVGADKIPRFTGRWIETTAALGEAMKAAIVAERDRIIEVRDYSLLAQNDESSALSITTLETHAGLIVDQVGAEIGAKKVVKLKDIQNTDFYAIKLVAGDEVMHAVRKADSSWRAKKAFKAISVLFVDNQFDLNASPNFSISKYIDFFILGEDVLISEKGNFESILNFKNAHKDDFVALQAEEEFTAVFSDVEALLTYVGENKIQLRRTSAIRQKGHYKNPDFMKNLKEHHAKYGLQLTFDDQGRLVPSMANCKDIFQALLDHRLASAFSNNIYDVQDTANVAV